MRTVISSFLTVYSSFVGIDPAGPLFYNVSSDERIDKSDAAFVDILHANAGSLLQVNSTLLSGHIIEPEKLQHSFIGKLLSTCFAFLRDA